MTSSNGETSPGARMRSVASATAATGGPDDTLSAYATWTSDALTAVWLTNWPTTCSCVVPLMLSVHEVCERIATAGEVACAIAGLVSAGEARDPTTTSTGPSQRPPNRQPGFPLAPGTGRPSTG